MVLYFRNDNLLLYNSEVGDIIISNIVNSSVHSRMIKYQKLNTVYGEPYPLV